jgi:ankyrin repeat/SOCS box protein 15
MILGTGSQLNVEDILFQTPLHNAAFHGHYDVIVLLLEMGVTINSKEVSPLHHAAFGGHDRCVSLLLEKGSWEFSGNFLKLLPRCQCEST